MITKNELLTLIENATVIDIPLETIIFDSKLYSRKDGIDKLAVNDYATKLTSMPPIVINYDNIIIDGVHRYHAALKTEQQVIKCKKIDLQADNIDIAGLILDLISGVRHPESDIKSMCIKKYNEDTKENQKVFTELGVPESTFYVWTSDIRKARQKELNKAMANALLNPFKTQQAIADEFHVSIMTISRIKTDVINKILAIRKMLLLNQNEHETEAARIIKDLDATDLDFLKSLMEFEPLLYSIWNTPKGDSHNDRFGHFPILFMKNVLYWFTKPYDFIYDPFGGGGTTADACNEMYRQWYLTDLTPDPSLTYIQQWDVKDGLPDMPKPSMVFLDPPYWLQAKDKYSESKNDLSNMPLDDFYAVLEAIIKSCISKRIDRVALVIAPTEYTNEGHLYEDHIFKIDKFFTAKYHIEKRYIIPYSTQQYNGMQVQIMKEAGLTLSIHRDLVIWKRGD